jgi:hypothetical protein
MNLASWLHHHPFLVVAVQYVGIVSCPPHYCYSAAAVPTNDVAQIVHAVIVPTSSFVPPDLD